MAQQQQQQQQQTNQNLLRTESDTEGIAQDETFNNGAVNQRASSQNGISFTEERDSRILQHSDQEQGRQQQNQRSGRRRLSSDIERTTLYQKTQNQISAQNISSYQLLNPQQIQDRPYSPIRLHAHHQRTFSNSTRPPSSNSSSNIKIVSCTGSEGVPLTFGAGTLVEKILPNTTPKSVHSGFKVANASNISGSSTRRFFQGVATFVPFHAQQQYRQQQQQQQQQPQQKQHRIHSPLRSTHIYATQSQTTTTVPTIVTKERIVQIDRPVLHIQEKTIEVEKPVIVEREVFIENRDEIDRLLKRLEEQESLNTQYFKEIVDLRNRPPQVQVEERVTYVEDLARVQLLEEQLRLQQADMQAQAERLKQREEEVNIYKEQLTTLQIERYDAQSLRENNESLALRLQEAEKQLKAVRQRLEDAEIDSRNHQQQSFIKLETIKNENTTLRNRIDELERESVHDLKLFQQKIENLKRDNLALSRYAEQAEKKISSIAPRIQEIERENAKLRDTAMVQLHSNRSATGSTSGVANSSNALNSTITNYYELAKATTTRPQYREIATMLTSTTSANQLANKDPKVPLSGTETVFKHATAAANMYAVNAQSVVPFSSAARRSTEENDRQFDTPQKIDYSNLLQDPISTIKKSPHSNQNSIIFSQFPENSFLQTPTAQQQHQNTARLRRNASAVSVADYLSSAGAQPRFF